jgi:hypothetical protein
MAAELARPTLAFASRRCISLFTPVALTSTRRATSRRDCPARTNRAKPSSKSCELGFTIPAAIGFVAAIGARAGSGLLRW